MTRRQIHRLSRSVAAANPTFPPFETVNCDDPVTRPWRQGYLGFVCVAGLKLRSASRSRSGVAVSHEFPASDTDSMLIVDDGVSAHLFLNAEGH